MVLHMCKVLVSDACIVNMLLLLCHVFGLRKIKVLVCLSVCLSVFLSVNPHTALHCGEYVFSLPEFIDVCILGLQVLLHQYKPIRAKLGHLFRDR